MWLVEVPALLSCGRKDARLPGTRCLLEPSESEAEVKRKEF
jgi:hypothetical protein